MGKHVEIQFLKVKIQKKNDTLVTNFSFSAISMEYSPHSRTPVFIIPKSSIKHLASNTTCSSFLPRLMLFVYAIHAIFIP